jgi:hypothetical protein
MPFSQSDLARAWERGREAKPGERNPYEGCMCSSGPSVSPNGLCCMACNSWLAAWQRPASQPKKGSK